VDRDRLAEMLRAGTIAPDAAVFDDERREWTTAGAVRGGATTASGGSPTTTGAPASPGRGGTVLRVAAWAGAGLLLLAAVYDLAVGVVGEAVLALVASACLAPPVVAFLRSRKPVLARRIVRWPVLGACLLASVLIAEMPGEVADSPSTATAPVTGTPTTAEGAASADGSAATETTGSASDPQPAASPAAVAPPPSNPAVGTWEKSWSTTVSESELRDIEAMQRAFGESTDNVTKVHHLEEYHLDAAGTARWVMRGTDVHGGSYDQAYDGTWVLDGGVVRLTLDLDGKPGRAKLKVEGDRLCNLGPLPPKFPRCFRRAEPGSSASTQDASGGAEAQPSGSALGTDLLIELIRIEPSGDDLWVLTFRATNLAKERRDLVVTSVTVEGRDGAPMGESATVGFEHLNPGQYQVMEQQWEKRGPVRRVLVNLTYPSAPGADWRLAVRSLIPGVSIVRQ
jgi:hypothetical protein